MAPITGEGAKSGVDRKLLESVSIGCNVSCGLAYICNNKVDAVGAVSQFSD